MSPTFLEMEAFAHQFLVPALAELRDKINADMKRALDHYDLKTKKNKHESSPKPMAREISICSDVSADWNSSADPALLGFSGKWSSLSGASSPMHANGTSVGLRDVDEEGEERLHSKGSKMVSFHVDSEEDAATDSQASSCDAYNGDGHHSVRQELGLKVAVDGGTPLLEPCCPGLSDDSRSLLLAAEDPAEELAFLLEPDILRGPAVLARSTPWIRIRMWQQKVAHLTATTTWDISVAALLICSVITLGIEADYTMRMGVAGRETVLPPVLRCMDVFFCCVFTAELMARVFALGRVFFVSSEAKWNILDFFLVVMQIIDIACADTSTAASATAEGGRKQTTMSFIRLLRITRMLRILRIVRFLRFVGELRAMITIILSSFQALFWGLTLFSFLIYVVAIVFLQALGDHVKSHGSDSVNSLLLENFASLPIAVVTLWGSITGGVQWSDLIAPLAQISPALALVFMLYVLFCLLAMMNAITGTFVETAMKAAKAEEEMFVGRSVLEHFQKMRAIEQGKKEHEIDEDELRVSWKELQEQLDTEELKNLFNALDVESSQVRGIFQLTDVNGEGFLRGSDLLHGWVRLQGSAKALDLALHMRKFEVHSEDVMRSLALLKAQLRNMSTAMKNRSSVESSASAGTLGKVEDGFSSEESEACSDGSGNSFAGLHICTCLLLHRSWTKILDFVFKARSLK
eukprot:TRINITY_DN36319_c0_g1_i1.p1 TRINITY_DN36319_c0_g1~~TRINITY_DN36319_c0_g1_i1.p1  ORF type:complete len:692 (+),score=191.61 TRINITY_DN36319_c0_g1_i1:98-2173(+)